MTAKSLQLIQVLRGIASLLVVLLHTTGNYEDNLGREFLGGFFGFGGSGVDIFFVLSGFIITYTSSRHLSDSSKFFPFVRRRFVRIYPVYWIIISGFLLMQIILPSFYKTHYDFTASNLLSTYLLLPGHAMVNGVSWTLTNELFFYILFSIAFFVPNKKLLLGLMGVYALSICVVYAAGYDSGAHNSWLNMFLFPMNIEFFLGIVSALVLEKLSMRYCKAMIITGSLLFLTAALLVLNQCILFDNPFNRVLYFGIPSFLIVTGVARLESVKNMKVHGFLLSLGDASYSLYLLHLPVIAAGTKILSQTGIKNDMLLHCIMLFVVLLICFGSVLFFKHIEKPLINKLNANKNQKAKLKMAG
jgi:peptidoglycan/LPS O-acetylase OafA/YrhL